MFVKLRFYEVSQSKEDFIKRGSELGGVEKVKALGANGEVSGSRLRRHGFGWFWMGELSLEEMSMKSVRGIFFGGFWVEELALDAMEYDDQDKWNEEDDL
ncbi:hypothetical protein Tco_0473986 [Tanacetum coccineum]